MKKCGEPLAITFWCEAPHPDGVVCTQPKGHGKYVKHRADFDVDGRHCWIAWTERGIETLLKRRERARVRKIVEEAGHGK